MSFFNNLTKYFLRPATCLACATIMLCTANAEDETIEPFEKTGFKEVTAQLNPDGDFYMYMSSASFMKSLDSLVNELYSEIIQEIKNGDSIPAEDRLNYTVACNVVKALIQDTGLSEVAGVGVSSIQIDSKLNHNRIVIQKKDGANGLIWDLFGKKSTKLDSLKLLPADTVLAKFQKVDINYLWNWLDEESKKSGHPMMAGGIGVFAAMAHTATGVDFKALLDTFEGEAGFIVTLDQKKMIDISASNPIPAMIPTPSAAMVLKVKDSQIFDTITKFAGTKLQGSEKSGIKYATFTPKSTDLTEMPKGIEIKPTLSYGNGLLIISLNPTIDQAIRSAQQSGKGLIASKEFKNMSTNMPKEGIGFDYMSPTLYYEINKIYSSGLKQLSEVDETKFLAKIMSIFYKSVSTNYMGYNVITRTDKGFVIYGNSNFSLATTAIVGSTVVPVSVVGILAAIAIPGLKAARDNSQKKSCIANMKQIAGATKAYLAENGSKKMPTMKELIDGGFLKSEPSCPIDGKYIMGTLKDTTPKCSYGSDHSLE